LISFILIKTKEYAANPDTMIKFVDASAMVCFSMLFKEKILLVLLCVSGNILTPLLFL